MAEENKDSEEGKALVSVSAEVSDALGYGKAASKLFETIGARLGQVFSGVGEFMNVMFLDKKRTDNDAYRTRELGAAEADAIQSKWRVISPIIGSGQQVQTMDITSGNVSANLTGASPEFIAFHQRSENRASLENAIHQLNLENATYYAAEELVDEHEVNSETVEPDWVTQWTKFARDASSEGMQKLWGRILAGEVKTPGSFSPRTLQVMSLLTQKEAQLFQRVCAYTWRDETENLNVVMLKESENNKLPPGFSYLELQTLQTIGLIEFELDGFFSFDGSNVRLTYNGSEIELIKPKHIFKDYVEAGQVNFTHIGTELASICNPNYDWCIMLSAMEHWMQHGYQVSSPYQPPQPAKPTDI